MEKVNNYEAIIILNPNTTEEVQKAFFKKNQATIASFSGEVNHLDVWGQRPLANPVDKISRGIYFHTTFNAGPDCISELERQFNISEDVIHYMHTRLDNRVTLSKHVENFKEVLKESNKRIEEREQKAQARRAAKKPRRPTTRS